MLNDDALLEFLKSLSEDEMIEKVILPLYQKRFRGKFHVIEFSGKDKREDGGVDLTYYEKTVDTKTKRYAGVQVKQGAINSGKGANGIAAIAIQAKQAFMKAIHDTTDKKEYRMQTYTLLTTGEIQARARATIVDEFEHEPIDFIDGKMLCEWIRESFESEIMALLKAAGREPVEVDDEEDLSPAETVAEYVRDHFKEDIEDIRATLNTLGSFRQKIVLDLMLHKSGTAFVIAKRLGYTTSMIEDDFTYLAGEGVIGFDDGGYVMEESANESNRVTSAIESRIQKLKYEEDVSVEEVFEMLI
jgi:hypothetical protein